MAPRAYGERIADMGVEAPPTLNARVLRQSSIAVTRLTCDADDHEMTPPLPLEDAYIVALELRDTFHQLWVDGRQVPLGLIKQGTTLLVNLNHRTEGIPARSFDTLHWYIPREALDVITDDQSVPSVKELRSPAGAKLDDATIRSVGMSLLPAFERPEQANRLFVDSVTTGLLAHLAHSYGAMSINRRLRRGGLAPWQERRAKELLIAHLDGEISLRELAREADLSRSHFARAFKETTGLPPHRWLVSKRVERAQEILINSTLSLVEVARLTGFADQSHFTRVFTSTVGITPGEWRRQRRV
jgi:AraC family transcriptional regulator